MGARGRRSRATGPRPSGQHFLRGRRLPAELVDQAAVLASDHVVELGAGDGCLTAFLAQQAAHVTAVELDPDLVERLRRRFAADPRVDVVADNILRVPFPASAHRAFGNVPFAITTAILRRLLDRPMTRLTRADLLVQYETARKRAAAWPSTLLSLGWAPWWEFRLMRRVPRGAFEPPPSVDAALLTIERRTVPLLPPSDRAAYRERLAIAFRASSRPVAQQLRSELTPGSWKRLARDRGLPRDAKPPELDVFDWVDLFRLLRVQNVKW